MAGSLQRYVALEPKSQSVSPFRGRWRLRLAVEKRGLVEVEVPAAMTLTAKAGDEVELLVSLGAEGALTLVALKGEDDADDHGIDFDAEDGEVEIEPEDRDDEDDD